MLDFMNQIPCNHSMLRVIFFWYQPKDDPHSMKGPEHWNPPFFLFKPRFTNKNFFNFSYVVGSSMGGFENIFWFRSNTKTNTQIGQYFRPISLITETTFQRENLVSNSMGYFFHHKRAPKTKFAAKCYRVWDFFPRNLCLISR